VAEGRSALLLVRHAHAGVRGRWVGLDRERPLSDVGWRQAEGLVVLLGGFGIQRILSSPYVRCVQTAQPLARALGLEVEPRDELAEDRPVGDAVALAEGLLGNTAALCSHGDILPPLLERLAAEHGVALPPDRPFAKGATWVMEALDRRLVSARDLPPPA
jgi:phosphohistidine phosphatase SixA